MLNARLTHLVTLGLGLCACDPASPSGSTERRSMLGAEAQSNTETDSGAVVMACADAQGGPRFDLIQTQTGYQAVTYVSNYDPSCQYEPWSCDYGERAEVLGTFDRCQFSEDDPRIVACWSLRDPNTVGRQWMSSTEVTRTQVPIGGGSIASYSELEIVAYDGDEPDAARREFRFRPDDCSILEPEPEAEGLPFGADCSGGATCAEGSECATTWDGYFCYYTACMPMCETDADCRDAAVAGGVHPQDAFELRCDDGVCDQGRLGLGGEACE